MIVSLASGDWTAEVQPDLGGSIAALRRRGADVFRPTPPGTDHPLATSCFPLVPYANRIADGRFHFDGHDYALPRNVADQAHPLHGVGWLVPWNVAASDAASVTLAHSHAADEHWPWAYAATQHIALSDRGLTVALTLTNRDTRPFPASLGLHPYFPTAGVTGLRFSAEAVWLTDDAFLPTEPVPADHCGDWAQGDRIDRPSLIDNSYAGWTGEAAIARTDVDLRLSAEGASFVHLFIPPALGFFCVEPVSAMPDAVNRTGAATLAPDAEIAITMRVFAV